MLRKTSLSLLAIAFAVAATPASATEPAAPPTIAPEIIAESAASEPTAPTAEEVALEPLTNEELGELRGGEALLLSNQTLVAITTGNIINGGYVAGSVSLSDNALSNFNGVGNLLINTGAQVSLQTGMNLTINVGD